jgi:hypothetical protein
LKGLADLDLDPGQNAQLFSQTLLRKLQEPYAKRIAGALTMDRPREDTAALIRDLAWVPPKRVQIYTQEDLAVSDLVKERIEGMTGTAWDWWPLALPKRHIAAGYSRVKWNTVSTLTPSRICKASSPAPGGMGEPVPGETGERNGDRMQRNFTSWGRFLSPASSGAGGFALPTRDRQDQVTGSADYDSPSPAVISGRLTLHKQMLRH